MRWSCIVARPLCLILLIVLSGFPLSATQLSRGEIREYLREHGDLTRTFNSFNPTMGLRDIVELTPLTVEGFVTSTDSRFSENDRTIFVYTDYVIQVTHIFRRVTPLAALPGVRPSLPFEHEASASRPALTSARIRLRVPNQGSVALEGGTLTDWTPDSPTLHVGQHVITSALFFAEIQSWVPFGTFEVRDGRVVHLESRFQTQDYDSVEAFAAALANPPPTAGR